MRSARSSDPATGARLLLAALLAAPLAAATPTGAAAQLRPMEVVHWRQGPETTALAGASAYAGARAPLAGLEGTLYETAVVQVSAAFGRAAVRVQGAHLLLDPDRRYAPPAPAVRDRGLQRITGFADVTVETLLYFPTPAGLMAGARLGGRIPSSSNEIGLDRDETDVYGTLMLGGGGETVWVETEMGVGIHGRRSDRVEQQDDFLYSAFLRARRGPLSARAGIIGHVFWLHDSTARGNENMGELHAGLRFGDRTFLDAALTVGLTATSPDAGLRLRVGRRFPVP